MYYELMYIILVIIGFRKQVSYTRIHLKKFFKKAGHTVGGATVREKLWWSDELCRKLIKKNNIGVSQKKN